MALMFIREPVFKENALKIMEWNNYGTKHSFVAVVVLRIFEDNMVTREFYEPSV